MHLMIYFELNDPVIGQHYNCTQKTLKLGIVSSFDPHSMCAKVERITAKTGCTSCTNWTISFKYEGFKRKLICYKGISFFKTYFNSRLFLHSICTIQSHILKFHPFLTSFAIFHAFNDLFSAKCPYNWKGLHPELRKGSNLAWYHHLTHITCVQKLRGLRQNLDALRVQTGPSLSKYKGFTRKLICYKHISFF